MASRAGVSAGVTVSDTDHGYRELVKRVFGGVRARVAVGVFSQDAHPDAEGLTMVALATIHEFGLGNVPERSFLRAYVDENEARIRKAAGALMQSVVEGRRTKEQALDALGLWMVGQVQKRIADGVPPPNAESTIAQKGSDTPLIDTGALRTAIKHKVDMSGSEGW